MFQIRTCLRPQIRCQEKLWFPLQSLGTTPRMKIFVNENGIKVNKKNYCKHLKKQLFPAIKKLVKRDDWIFVQDSAPSHRTNLIQDFLKKTLKRRFVKCVEWPPSSSDVNPLDYFFWDLLKTKVYQGRVGEPFSSEEE